MKHAFLIIAHSEPELFRILISMLDHQDCDLYVHIDRKSDINLFDKVKTAHSQIFFIEDRTDVKWGHYSQIQTEMKLFEAANKRQEYAYYHLLSGVEIPGPLDHGVLLVIGHGLEPVHGPPILKQGKAKPGGNCSVVHHSHLEISIPHKSWPMRRKPMVKMPK